MTTSLISTPQIVNATPPGSDLEMKTSTHSADYIPTVSHSQEVCTNTAHMIPHIPIPVLSSFLSTVEQTRMEQISRQFYRDIQRSKSFHESLDLSDEVRNIITVLKSYRPLSRNGIPLKNTKLKTMTLDRTRISDTALNYIADWFPELRQLSLKGAAFPLMKDGYQRPYHEMDDEHLDALMKMKHLWSIQSPTLIQYKSSFYLQWMQRNSGQGNALAQRELGKAYLTEIKPEGSVTLHIDTELGKKWLLGSALQGNASAQYELGIMETNRIEWLQKSAEAGYGPAQSALGERYFNGQGVAQSDQEAFKWFLKAAGNGQREAQRSLATLYKTGRGVPRNFREYLSEMEKVAKQDYEYREIGLHYFFGLGVKERDDDYVQKDYEKAKKWLIDRRGCVISLTEPLHSRKIKAQACLATGVLLFQESLKETSHHSDAFKKIKLNQALDAFESAFKNDLPNSEDEISAYLTELGFSEEFNDQGIRQLLESAYLNELWAFDLVMSL